MKNNKSIYKLFLGCIFGYALIAFNKSGVCTTLNVIAGACVIDSGYQGEIHIHLINVSKKDVFITPDMKIMQFVLIPVSDVQTEECDLEVLYEFHKEGEATEEEIDHQYSLTLEKFEDVEFKNMLSSDEDKLSAVLQITAGAGGTESCDWASILLRMYKMWAEKNNYKLSTN